MAQTSLLSISGYTPESIPVISGFSHFANTEGLPLEIILMWCQERKFVVDWMDYIQGCLKDGHNFRTIRARIISACSDIYGRDYSKEIEKRLALLA